MMATIEATIEKLLERHRGDLLTKSEVVNSLLLALADVDEAQHVILLFYVFPDEFQTAVLSRLDELQDSAFNWRPFMIGEGLSEGELERLSKRLRFIHDTLRICD